MTPVAVGQWSLISTDACLLLCSVGRKVFVWINNLKKKMQGDLLTAENSHISFLQVLKVWG